MKKKKAPQTDNDRLRLAVDYGKVPRTVHTDLLLRGHDEDFVPTEARWPTDALAGSVEKIEVMRLRVEVGESLWHGNDNMDQIVAHRLTREPALRELFVVPVPNARRKSLP
ncbi:MAG: hypothetical protein IPH59_11880 [bacterium]|nr:hypothetical protein [bacterium]